MPYHPLSQRQKKLTTSLHYTEILNNIPLLPPSTSLQKCVHNHIVISTIQNLQPNNILQELTLLREMRIHLVRLCCGHHPSLNQYKNRLNPTQDPLCPMGIQCGHCPHCNAAPYTTQHLFTSCTSLTQLRQSFNITSIRDLWECLAKAASYFQSTGFAKT